MATQFDHGQVMKSKRKEKVKVEANGIAGIVLIGGTLIAAAAGAAFVAHRARSSNRGRGRKNDTVNKEEEMGLQSLLSMKGEEFSDDSLVGSQESNSEKSEIGEEGEKGEEGSEGTGDSSTESNSESVWPAEVIEEQKELLEVKRELNQISEKLENFEDRVQEIDQREEEFSFHRSDQIQEIACEDSEIIIKETREMGKLDADNVESVDGNCNVEEFSFWTDKLRAPENYIEQNLAELGTAHVTEEDKSETEEDKAREIIEENIEIIETSEISVEQEEPQSTENDEIKKEVEISKEIEDTFGSEGEDKSSMLQELLSSADSCEQENEHVLLATSEGNACNGFENPEMTVEATENLSEANINDDDGFVQESDVTLVREEEENNPSISIQKVQEELAESRNSHEEFGEQSFYPEDVTAQEKMDCPISVTVMKRQTEVTNKPNGEVGENSEDLEVEDKEVEIVEENEDEEQKGGDNKQRGLSEESVEKDDRTTAGNHTFLPSSFKHEIISENGTLETQDKMCMNSDTETEESQNTCNKTEMVMDVGDSSSVLVFNHENLVHECSSSETAFNSLQDKNNQDLKESDIAHVEEGKFVEEEEETEFCTETISENEMTEEEKGSAIIENEMKLKFEVTKKTADKDQGEHEQEVVKKDLERKSTDKEKRMDSILLGSSKIFLLVLALSLVLGLIAFAHHDQLPSYKHHLPEIYHQVYQLIFPSYDGAIGEF